MEDIKALENQAKSGDIDSIIDIALLAIEDKYDKQKAIEYLLTTSEERKDEVYYCLYELYQQKADFDTESLDYETAQKYLYLSAELGNETAFWMIIEKEDRAGNYEKAIPYIHKFVEQNDGFAMTLLGDYYLEGKGVEKSSKNALTFYEKALGVGHTSTYLSLGNFYLFCYDVEKDKSKAKEYFEKALEHNHIEAFGNIGFLYYWGEGVEQDYKKAFAYYLKGAESGDYVAQYKVGCMYRDGEGVDVDFEKAFEWLKKAIEQNYYKAFNDIGNLYEHGEGTNQNYDLAIESFKNSIRLARFNGKKIPTAHYNLGRIYFHGKGVEINYKKALEHFNYAIDNFNPKTMKQEAKEDSIKYKTKIEGLKLAYENGEISRVLLQKKFSIGYPVASETFEWLLEKAYIDKDGKTIISEEEYENLLNGN